MEFPPLLWQLGLDVRDMPVLAEHYRREGTAMEKSTRLKVILGGMAALVLVCLPNPAAARRGGGGFHGGGGKGFHGGGKGGGGHFSGKGGGRFHGGGSFRGSARGMAPRGGFGHADNFAYGSSRSSFGGNWMNAGRAGTVPASSPYFGRSGTGGSRAWEGGTRWTASGPHTSVNTASGWHSFGSASHGGAGTALANGLNGLASAAGTALHTAASVAGAWHSFASTAVSSALSSHPFGSNGFGSGGFGVSGGCWNCGGGGVGWSGPGWGWDAYWAPYYVYNPYWAWPYYGAYPPANYDYGYAYDNGNGYLQGAPE